jgi:hypothetical protein
VNRDGERHPERQGRRVRAGEEDVGRLRADRAPQMRLFPPRAASAADDHFAHAGARRHRGEEGQRLGRIEDELPRRGIRPLDPPPQQLAEVAADPGGLAEQFARVYADRDDATHREPRVR